MTPRTRLGLLAALVLSGLALVALWVAQPGAAPPLPDAFTLAATASATPRDLQSATPTPAPTTPPPPSATPPPALADPCDPRAPVEVVLAAPAPVRCTFTVVASYPHDAQAFTQGLVYEGEGVLIEGTGLNNRSSLRRVKLETGEVVQQHDLAAEYFGEGVAVLGERIYQLTWQSQLGFVYDRASFALQRTFAYPTEGWGLTHDGQRLILSDGTDVLYFLDPEQLVETGRVLVTAGEEAVFELNELEYINGFVYANVWTTDQIAKIDPASGRVVAWIDLTGLLPAEARAQGADVLNGIAYDAAGDRLFVTGKLWPQLFEIDLRLAAP